MKKLIHVCEVKKSNGDDELKDALTCIVLSTSVCMIACHSVHSSSNYF